MPHPPNRTLSSRYLEARIVKVFPDGGLEAEPKSSAGTDASKIKVHRYHLPPDRLPPNEPYRPGETISLFIYDDQRAARDPAKAAYASAVWATPSNNPWENELEMEVGGIVTGSVIHFPDDLHAVVLLDRLLVDAWLDAKEVPEAPPYYRHDDNRPLASFLSLNDRIKARLQRVDRGNCRIDISIVTAFEEWKNECKQNTRSEAMPPPGYKRLRLAELADHEEQIFLWQPTTDSAAESPMPREITTRTPDDTSQVADLPIWQHVRLLVIENDTAFAQSLKAWVRSQGGTVLTASGQADLDKLLRNGKIDDLQLTHVLCDFNLSSQNESSACHAWVKTHLGRQPEQSAIRVAWMSALPERVRHAQDASLKSPGHKHDDGHLSPYLAKLPLFVKPIFFSDLHAWLTTGRAPRRDDDLTDDERNQIWNSSRPDEPVSDRGRAALEQFCTNSKALAALWIDAPEDALAGNEYDDTLFDFQVRAWHGLARLPENWHFGLGQSLLRDVFFTQMFAGQRVTISGPLRTVAPGGSEWVVVWPIVSFDAPATDGASLPSSTPPHGMLLAYFNRDLRHPTPVCGQHGAIGRLAALTCRHLDDLGTLLSLNIHAREQDLFASTGRQLAAVLHELRSLSGDLAALVADESATAQPPAMTRSARNALRKLLKVAQQGLFYVRKERPEQLGLAGMLQRMTADLLWLPIHHSGCSFHVLLPPKAMQVTLPVEPLEHALDKIISNAVHWSWGRPYARVSVSVELQPQFGDMPLCIRISDQGLGIGHDAERNLFSPRLTQKGRKGYGMGLYISRTLLRSIGGDLLFDRHNSFRFFGATFEIRLPLCLGERVPHQNVDRRVAPGN